MVPPPDPPNESVGGGLPAPLHAGTLMAVTASRAQIDAAWRPLTAAVAGQDGGAVLAAIPAAVGVGLLHECGES